MNQPVAHEEVVAALLANGAICTPKGSDTLLHVAARQRLPAVTETLIAKGANVNARGENGRTPLHYVSYQNNSKVGAVLLQHGADVNAKDKDGQTPLYTTIKDSSRWGPSDEASVLDTVSMLLSYHADPNIAAGDGNTPLQVAGYTRYSLIRILLDHGADPNLGGPDKILLNAADVSPNSATVSNDRELVGLLLAHGASPNVKDKTGETVLQKAAARGDLETVQMLIQHGAEVNAVEDNGSTPLMIAAAGGCCFYSGSRHELVALLLANKADPNLRGPGRCLTALSEATRQSDFDSAKQLIDDGADPNGEYLGCASTLHWARTPELATLLLKSGAHVNVADPSGITPLDEAISEHATEVAKIFIAQGAEVGTKAAVNTAPTSQEGVLREIVSESKAGKKRGTTPLHLSASVDDPVIARLLLDKGVDVNARDTQGKTPLHRAAEAGARDVAELLVASNADVNAMDDEGQTPLHLWAASGHDGIEVLILHNARLNARDKAGETPLSRAAGECAIQPLKSLLKSQAQVNTRDAQGHTPLWLARDSCEPVVAETLQKYGAK